MKFFCILIIPKRCWEQREEESREAGIKKKKKKKKFSFKWLNIFFKVVFMEVYQKEESFL